MARVRLLKPGFFANENLAILSPWHRLLFAGLWVMADREGRLLDRPGHIRAVVFPFDERRWGMTATVVDTMLDDLDTADFIRRYTYPDPAHVDDVPAPALHDPRHDLGQEPSARPDLGTALHLPRHDLGKDEHLPLSGENLIFAITILTFGRHQHPHVREAPSEILPPTRGSRRKLLTIGTSPGTAPTLAGARHDLGEDEHQPRSYLGFALHDPRHDLGSVEPGGVRCTVYGEKYADAEAASALPQIPKNEDGPDEPAEPPAELPAAPEPTRGINPRVLAKLARDILDTHPELADADLRDLLKRRCALDHLAYDAATVAKAVDVAHAIHRRQAHA